MLGSQNKLMTSNSDQILFHKMDAVKTSYGRSKLTFPFNKASVKYAYVTQNGKKLITHCVDSSVKVFDIDSANTNVEPESKLDRVSCVCIAPNGLRAVLGFIDFSVKVSDLKGDSLKTPVTIGSLKRFAMRCDALL